MANSPHRFNSWTAVFPRTNPHVETIAGESESGFSQAVATKLTKTASKQTYFTVRLLVDRDRVADAYRAYAYFRWLDDWIDNQDTDRHERIAFVLRQKALLECGYQGDWPTELLPEEQMLADLIKGNPEQSGGLHSYLQNMMAVMAFDAERRGRLISQAELDTYSLHLATAVTEALHFFIGHNDPSPHTEARYLAATGAHIAHMLRDTYEDTAAGYFNIPRELLLATGLKPGDIQTGRYMAWVQRRVKLARGYLKAGKRYLTEVKNVRCRLAGYAYIARFEHVLNAIARQGYWLRPDYHERKRLSTAFEVGSSAILRTLWSCLVRTTLPHQTDATRADKRGGV